MLPLEIFTQYTNESFGSVKVKVACVPEIGSFIIVAAVLLSFAVARLTVETSDRMRDRRRARDIGLSCMRFEGSYSCSKAALELECVQAAEAAFQVAAKNTKAMPLCNRIFDWSSAGPNPDNYDGLASNRWGLRATPIGKLCCALLIIMGSVFILLGKSAGFQHKI